MEMTAEKYMAKERDLECMRVSRVDSSSNTIPSETLEVTCKSLVKHMQHRIDRYLNQPRTKYLQILGYPK
jgi:hypothetical protein